MTQLTVFLGYERLHSLLPVSGARAPVVGVAFEYGTVTTDKGWNQDYMTSYNFAAGFGGSLTANGINVTEKGGNKPTFSDWQGAYYGIGISYGYFGFSAGGSKGYYVQEISIGPGIGLKKNIKWNGFLGVGKTTLIGKPYRDPVVDPSVWTTTSIMEHVE